NGAACGAPERSKPRRLYPTHKASFVVPGIRSLHPAASCRRVVSGQIAGRPNAVSVITPRRPAQCRGSKEDPTTEGEIHDEPETSHPRHDVQRTARHRRAV